MEGSLGMKDVQATILQRASLRQYDPNPLSEEDREHILLAAERAPTAGNMMLYTILEVRDQRIKDVLAESCDHQPFIARAPLVLVFLADFQRWQDFYVASGVEELCAQRDEPFRTPQESDLLLACCDALIAAQNTVIMAESRGIGSCYIGDIMERYEQHRELFSLPPWAFPITMLCYGRPPAGYRQNLRPRLDRKFFVQQDRYRPWSQEDLEDMAHQPALLPKKLREGASNPGQHWYLRKTGEAFSREMERSVKVALRRWLNGSSCADR